MFNKIGWLCMLCLFTSSLFSQKDRPFRLGAHIGLLGANERDQIGAFINLEPQLQSSKNTSLGLRLSISVNSLGYRNSNPTQYTINRESGNGSVSIIPSFNYHWNQIKFRPHLGIGIGPYLLVSYLDIHPFGNSSADSVIEVNVGPQIGGLLKGGLEFGKTSLSLEYNFTPKTDIELANGQLIGEVDRSYFGLSVGFIFGGRKS